MKFIFFINFSELASHAPFIDGKTPQLWPNNEKPPFVSFPNLEEPSTDVATERKYRFL